MAAIFVILDPYRADRQVAIGNHVIEERSHWVFSHEPNRELWQIWTVFPGIEVYRSLMHLNESTLEYKQIDDDTIEVKEYSFAYDRKLGRQVQKPFMRKIRL
ncbi:MAG: hypothetical protein MN733_20205 [Nitrososphaera sp.]|nr:hypothetical protein [Nitrososphaera sp.]